MDGSDQLAFMRIKCGGGRTPVLANTTVISTVTKIDRRRVPAIALHYVKNAVDTAAVPWYTDAITFRKEDDHVLPAFRVGGDAPCHASEFFV